MSIIERVAEHPTFACPCGRVWALSGPRDQSAWVVAGHGAAMVRGDEHFTCYCGQGFDLIRRKDLPTTHAV